MNSKKVYIGMCCLLGLLGVLLITAVGFGDMFLRKQSVKLVGLKLDNQVVEAQQVALAQAKKDIDKYKELKVTSKQIVPQEKEQTQATREIVSLAELSGVKIGGISFPPSNLGQAPAKIAPSADGGTAVKPAAPPSTVTQVKPVEGIKGLYQLDIVVNSDTANPTTYPRLIDFLSRLEQNRRTAQVTQITINPDTLNRQNLNFSLTVTIYVKS